MAFLASPFFFPTVSKYELEWGGFMFLLGVGNVSR